MRFSRSLKCITYSKTRSPTPGVYLPTNPCEIASKHCQPSPDGKLVATLFPSVVNIRSIDTLEVINVVRLPQEFSGPILSFQWSPSSQLLLVAVVDQIQVFSALPGGFQSTISNAVPPATKPTYIGFSPQGTEICVCSSFGLKFGIFDLKTSRSVEVANPKLFSSATACNGFSFRPMTHHLALLTRTAGKDMISIHDPETRELQRSWHPETVDAQGLKWSPDGKWLVVWESAGQGHKVVFYTADGHIFKSWLGPSNATPGSQNFELGAGVKQLQFSADACSLAIGDSSKSTFLFDMASISETMTLLHPKNVTPTETIQIWQEQVNITQAGPSIHTFMKAVQTISPQTRPKDTSESKSGCSSILFDSSSVLVATCFENSPSTLWIWDTQASELRAVLLFHSNISSARWHPTSREMLLVRCEGDLYSGIVFVWDPLSEGPRTVDFSEHLPEFKPSNRSQAAWLGCDASKSPSIFFSDGWNYMFASLAESDQESPPWQDRREVGWNSEVRREESPLELVPANTQYLEAEEDEEDNSEVEDTFHYKQ